jgi:hypothetical protein
LHGGFFADRRSDSAPLTGTGIPATDRAFVSSSADLSRRATR